MNNVRFGALVVANLAVLGLLCLTLGYVVLWHFGWQTGLNTARHLSLHASACGMTVLVCVTVALTGAALPAAVFAGALGTVFGALFLFSWGVGDSLLALTWFHRTGWPAVLIFCAIVIVYHLFRGASSAPSQPVSEPT